MTKKTKRVTVDAEELGLDTDELREILGIAPDIWETMPDSQKLLILARRGVKASIDAIQADIEDSD